MAWTIGAARLLSVLLIAGLFSSATAESAQALLPPTLVSIDVSPVVASIGIGQTEQFTATGLYSDLSTKDVTDSVTWASSSKTTATVSTHGLATGVATGAVTISATDPSTPLPGTAALTVTPAVLIGIDVSPVVASIGIGQTEQFTATGLYSDLSTKNVTDSVTWASSSKTTATVSTHGLATGVADRGRHHLGHRSRPLPSPAPPP